MREVVVGILVGVPPLVETPWFSVATPPVRRGWYKVRLSDNDRDNSLIHNGHSYGRPESYTRVAMRYWSGKKWKWVRARFDGGRFENAQVPPDAEWCGLAQEYVELG